MSLRVLDISFPDPALNLALDEVLLDEVAQGAREVLRFWESPRRFVVLGTSQVLKEEVQEAHCLAEEVPILRRCTAGGCVLQGPGSLNFTLALRYDRRPEVKTLHASYCYILNRIAAGLQQLSLPVRHEGVCDLACEGRKVSGNAQRRKRTAMLHHGTLLHQADIAGMQRYLREPVDRPEYRGGRAHESFVQALPLSHEQLKQVVINAFEGEGGTGALLPEELLAAERLAEEKYRTRAWTYRR